MGGCQMSEYRVSTPSQEPTRLSVPQVAQIAAARIYARLGWPGCAGLILSVLSLAALAWLHQVKHLSAIGAIQDTVSEAVTRAPAPQPVRITPPALPHSADSVRLVKHIKEIVQGSGLSWPQADYRITPLSDEGLATLEIRTTIKGPYPKLRQLIATLLDKEPALALRELTLARPNGDTPEVEAKIRWVVFLADGWAPAEAGGKP
jgi:DNA-binding transcriptional ArsR family regulator